VLNTFNYQTTKSYITFFLTNIQWLFTEDNHSMRQLFETVQAKRPQTSNKAPSNSFRFLLLSSKPQSLPLTQKTLLLCLTIFCLNGLGCATVTIETSHYSPIRPPDITNSVTFSWFGLKGKHHFDTNKLCHGQPSVKIQAVHTLTDLLDGLKTGFFFLPKTAKIWCKTPIQPTDNPN